MNWTVKGVKSWQGREGIGTNCSLYRDGKKVADCHDAADGGPWDIHWKDTNVPRVAVNITIDDYEAEKDENGNRPEKAHSYKGTPEEKLLVEHANGQQYEAYGTTMRHSADSIIAELCDEYETRKRMRARLRKATWFRLKNETYQEGEYRTVKAPWSQRVKDFLVNKYGDDLGEILNEKYEVKMAA